MLGQAGRFFREEDALAGDVLTGWAASSQSSSEKLYFIASGSVEVQVCAVCFVLAVTSCLLMVALLFFCFVFLAFAYFEAEKERRANGEGRVAKLSVFWRLIA